APCKTSCDICRKNVTRNSSSYTRKIAFICCVTENIVISVCFHPQPDWIFDVNLRSSENLADYLIAPHFFPLISLQHKDVVIILLSDTKDIVEGFTLKTDNARQVFR